MYYVCSLFADCNKVLLVYGLTNLAKMEDESLDKMDPYQRGASDISKFQSFILQFILKYLLVMVCYLFITYL